MSHILNGILSLLIDENLQEISWNCLKISCLLWHLQNQNKVTKTTCDYKIEAFFEYLSALIEYTKNIVKNINLDKSFHIFVPIFISGKFQTLKNGFIRRLKTETSSWGQNSMRFWTTKSDVELFTEIPGWVDVAIL